MDTRDAAWDRFWSEVHKPGNVNPSGFTRWAVPFLRSAGTRTVLDLGCGPGRDMSFLLEQGFSVTGVDCSTVAVSLARENVSRLHEDARGRSKLVHAGILDFLGSMSMESVDAVHATATYQGLSEEELGRLFREVHRVLVPNGLHVWSVRSERHVGKTQPERVPPNFPALGHTVLLRFFTRDDTERLTKELFERLGFSDVEVAPGLSSYRIVDCKPHGESVTPET